MSISAVSPADAMAPALLDVRAVAALLHCSTRHVYRLADAGRMPPPVRIGALVRWSRRCVEDWIAAGCPAVRHDGEAGA
jgi:excisionase family DNA binding protein